MSDLEDMIADWQRALNDIYRIRQILEIWHERELIKAKEEFDKANEPKGETTYGAADKIDPYD